MWDICTLDSFWTLIKKPPGMRPSQKASESRGFDFCPWLVDIWRNAHEGHTRNARHDTSTQSIRSCLEPETQVKNIDQATMALLPTV